MMESEFESLNLGSKRFNKRFTKSMQTLASAPQKSIYSASSTRGEAKAIYRMLNNSLFDLKKIKAAHKKTTIDRIKEHIRLR
ncbi:MAG: hypothetical protein LBG13_00105 [Holosporales bacterium]|nr:hypothetical protein [Holosporales bacterium]